MSIISVVSKVRSIGLLGQVVAGRRMKNSVYMGWLPDHKTPSTRTYHVYYKPGRHRRARCSQQGIIVSSSSGGGGVVVGRATSQNIESDYWIRHSRPAILGILKMAKDRHRCYICRYGSHITIVRKHVPSSTARSWKGKGCHSNLHILI